MLMSNKRHPPPTVSDVEARVLLDRYKCAVPFHEVRTRFLGNIASPGIGESPIKVIEQLWGGKLPEFESIEAANELIGALVMGVWNRLTQHQERNSPFRLTRVHPAATREGLATLAQIRCQELDGFVEGLFGLNESIALPERAHHGLDDLSKIRAMFAAVLDVAMDEMKPATDAAMETTIKLMREMTKNAETEVNAVVRSCTIARRQMLPSLLADKPTLH
jgi:hypothetical protein